MAKHGKEDVVEGGNQHYATKGDLDEVRKSMELIRKGPEEHRQQMEQHNQQMEKLTLAINALVVQASQKKPDTGEPSDRFSSYRGNYEHHCTPPVVNSSPASIVRSVGLFMHEGGMLASSSQTSVPFNAARVIENMSASRNLGAEGLGSSPLFPVLMSTQVPPLLTHPMGQNGEGYTYTLVIYHVLYRWEQAGHLGPLESPVHLLFKILPRWN